ncbi:MULTISPECIES: 1,4-dihydroxy-2-naphthoate octaprenyltransferase [unclassified Oceanobacter]|uniref:1,4-dihydroxy-2-naphthoate octaprenyltransferase n=1 Tax=unclassified Oceanobacter TaxID=2620260 RepID=UPI002736CE9F|nr:MULTISPECIES: 1,4-dihydroxy-2-naphthoate octaprenyltransferase [unclassified Oceanobacter]MDP2608175.1 1,4-dihydroxy-2-naphthoate octaprenyltransferase [Oceanobacter sp. 1_MG-2023]MDP2612901.1 1,4-dihydroxy-2-naphthoate octaprenyltransferase [Oceanobacter sp. 2_MG-2023]
MSYWWLAIRPKTIPASIGPILLGTALASTETQLNGLLFGLAILCAVALQIAVNLANDLFDGLSGVDTEARLGPARMVQSGFITPAAMAVALAIFTLLATLFGLTLAALTSWNLLFIGIACLLAVFAYSAGPAPLASMGLGEVTVLVFFGWIAVMGSYWLQTGELTVTAWLYGTSAGLFSVAILLVNNLRDIPTDLASGKLTLPARLGETRTRRLFVGVMIAALLVHLVAAWPCPWLMLLPAGLCLKPVLNLIRRIDSLRGRALNSLLAQTAQAGLIYCGASATLLMLLASP